MSSSCYYLAGYPLFRALAFLARYDDFGQKKDLARAESGLKHATSLAMQNKTDAFWAGLSLFQHGYILTQRKEGLRGGMTTRKGAGILEGLATNTDAQAMFGIYNYYLANSVAFVKDSRQQSLNALQKGYKESRYFSNLYANALVWILYDLKNYDAAHKICSKLLSQYPENRVFRQIKGDILRRAKRYPEALKEYLKSNEQYQKAPKAIRAVSAVGNLTLIYKALNNDVEYQKHRSDLLKRLPEIKDRMPPSLMEELRKAKVIED